MFKARIQSELIFFRFSTRAESVVIARCNSWKSFAHWVGSANHFLLFWRQSVIHPRFKSVAQKLVIQKYVGYDANNDYHQGVGYFAYDEAKVVNIVLIVNVLREKLDQFLFFLLGFFN